MSTFTTEFMASQFLPIPKSLNPSAMTFMPSQKECISIELNPEADWFVPMTDVVDVSEDYIYQPMHLPMAPLMVDDDATLYPTPAPCANLVDIEEDCSQDNAAYEEAEEQHMIIVPQKDRFAMKNGAWASPEGSQSPQPLSMEDWIGIREWFLHPLMCKPINSGATKPAPEEVDWDLYAVRPWRQATTRKSPLRFDCTRLPPTTSDEDWKNYIAKEWNGLWEDEEADEVVDIVGPPAAVPTGIDELDHGDEDEDVKHSINPEHTLEMITEPTSGILTVDNDDSSDIAVEGTTNMNPKAMLPLVQDEVWEAFKATEWTEAWGDGEDSWDQDHGVKSESQEPPILEDSTAVQISRRPSSATISEPSLTEDDASSPSEGDPSTSRSSPTSEYSEVVQTSPTFSGLGSTLVSPAVCENNDKGIPQDGCIAGDEIRQCSYITFGQMEPVKIMKKSHRAIPRITGGATSTNVETCTIARNIVVANEAETNEASLGSPFPTVSISTDIKPSSPEENSTSTPLLASLHPPSHPEYPEEHAGICASTRLTEQDLLKMNTALGAGCADLSPVIPSVYREASSKQRALRTEPATPKSRDPKPGADSQVNAMKRLLGIGAAESAMGSKKKTWGAQKDLPALNDLKQVLRLISKGLAHSECTQHT